MFTRRNLFRLAIFLAFAALASLTLPESCATARALLPALSPLLNWGGAIATWTAGILTPLAVPLLLLPLVKGRFFCWRLCPMGFAAETAGRLNPRGAGLIRRMPFVGKGLALVILASAAAGYPLLIWTDPLCIFNGFFSAWRAPLTWGSAATAAGFVLVLLASVACPNIWCHRLCPLGGLQELLTQLGKRLAARRPVPEDQPQKTPDASPLQIKAGRRVFMGFALGGLSGLAYGKLKTAAPDAAPVIRPPGALTAINALCARCGNCMKACPYGLIVPDLGASGVDGLLTPVLAFRSRNAEQEEFCFQECNACTRVCPTGAIQRLDLADKKQVAIGVAKIDKKRCIAWEKGEYCVVCQEFCPYQAIAETERNGVNCPTVNEDQCRGCGACESQCPALPVAIVVRGRAPQPRLEAPAP